MTGIEPAYSSNRCGIRTSGVVVEVIGSVVADFPGRAPFRLPQVLRELPSGGPWFTVGPVVAWNQRSQPLLWWNPVRSSKPHWLVEVGVRR